MFYRLIFFILIFLLPLGAEDYYSVDKAKSKSGVELLLTQYEWSNMWKEITITPKVTTCEPANTKKGMISPFIATLSEPLYIAEVTIKKGEVKAFNSSLLSDPAGTGTNKSSGGIYVNIIKFPLMNMLLKNSTKGMLAFEKGSPKITYLGILDPKKWNNVLALSMIPERSIFASIKGQLASAVSCVGYTSLEYLSAQNKRTSSTGEKLKDLINTFHYSMGCLGPIPTGTSSMHQDSISNGLITISSVFSDMFSRKGVVSDISVNHTTRNILNNYSKKILCHSIPNPLFPQTAYTVQLIYPTVSKTHEWGISPSEYNFNGAGESGKLVVFVISQRRDYAAFAYQE